MNYAFILIPTVAYSNWYGTKVCLKKSSEKYNCMLLYMYTF